MYKKRRMNFFTRREPSVHKVDYLARSRFQGTKDCPKNHPVGDSAESRNQGLRDLFANTEETVASIPAIVPPTEAEATPGNAPAEIRNVAVATDLADGA